MAKRARKKTTKWPALKKRTANKRTPKKPAAKKRSAKKTTAKKTTPTTELADVLKRFGERVRALRTEQGYSQSDFAATCGLDRTYMGGIERGERNLALRNIELVAQTLGMTMSELLDGV